MTHITIARGDGIGPEIMDATLRVLKAAGADIQPEEVVIGESIYKTGISSGIELKAWDSLRRTRVFLKAPITTPMGGGVKSLNVTVRKTLGLFANVRPVRSYAPFVDTKHPDIDVVIVRENEEDLYSGIEHRQTAEVTQCLKLISAPGSERISRFAFDYARRLGRKKVSCFVKDNIMKITDGLFRRSFDKIGDAYPDIERDRRIIDIGTALLADKPEMFDVIVTLNLYGDILSDVAAQIAGSVGMAGSANLGATTAMFEAVHGSAPDIAGRDVANPSGLINAAVMMLVHIEQPEVATTIQNAWLRTLEDGIHTADVFSRARSTRLAGTAEFADAVIERLGEVPRVLAPAVYRKSEPVADARAERANRKTVEVRATKTPKPAKQLVGVDVFVDWDEIGRLPDELAKSLQRANSPSLQLKIITNRGVKVWPDGAPETFRTDHWRCRYYATGDEVEHGEVVKLLAMLQEIKLDFIKIENLYTFNGEPGYSLAQGE